MKRVRIGDLRRCLAGAFERLGLRAEDADGLAGLLLDSELRGHRDHGIAALAPLTRMYSDGTLNPRPAVRVLRESVGALLLDGDRGCGPGAPDRAMRWCVERARERGGIATAAVRDWQLLVGAPYARLAADAGMVGFACTNFIPLVAPPGGRTPVLGTNPFAYGVPAGRHPPVVLDVATTVVAMQKVRVAAAAGEAFGPREEFLARMDALIDQVKSGERAPGVDELVLPGERGERRLRELTAGGELPLDEPGWQMLASGCEALGVALPVTT